MKNTFRSRLAGLLAITGLAAVLVACGSSTPDDPGESTMNSETSAGEVVETWEAPMEPEHFECLDYSDLDPAESTPESNAKGVACGRVGAVLVPVIEALLDGGKTTDTFVFRPFLAGESVACDGEQASGESYFVVTWCAAEGYMAIDVIRAVNDDDIEMMHFVDGSTLWALSTRVVSIQPESSMSDQNIACMAGALSVHMAATSQEVVVMRDSLFLTDAAVYNFGEGGAVELSELFTDGVEGNGCLTG